MSENNQFKTLALVAAGALFGYTIAKSRFTSRSETKSSFNFKDINRVQDPSNLLKYVKGKLRNYPPILDRKLKRIVETKDPSEFRVLQFNILARALWYQEGEIKVPIETYDWQNYRLWRTLEELIRHDCDILCIEEADVYEELKPYLHSIGYTSIFCPKFFSPCLEMETSFGPDGCAIFYRLSQFEPINMSCEKINTFSEINSQIFIILQLKHKQTKKLLTLVCLHLKSKVEFHEKREAQIAEVLKSLKTHLIGSLENDYRNHPVLILGDFNGEPFERFYNLIENDDDLCLRDAYTFEFAPKEPTTIKKRKSNDMIRRAIDYIFYSPNSLQLTEYLELPKNDDAIDQHGLPNLSHPSDHLSLVASFKFI